MGWARKDCFVEIFFGAEKKVRGEGEKQKPPDDSFFISISFIVYMFFYQKLFENMIWI